MKSLGKVHSKSNKCESSKKRSFISLVPYGGDDSAAEIGDEDDIVALQRRKQEIVSQLVEVDNRDASVSDEESLANHHRQSSVKQPSSSDTDRMHCEIFRGCRSGVGAEDRLRRHDRSSTDVRDRKLRDKGLGAAAIGRSSSLSRTSERSRTGSDGSEGRIASIKQLSSTRREKVGWSPDRSSAVGVHGDQESLEAEILRVNLMNNTSVECKDDGGQIPRESVGFKIIKNNREPPKIASDRTGVSRNDLKSSAMLGNFMKNELRQRNKKSDRVCGTERNTKDFSSRGHHDNRKALKDLVDDKCRFPYKNKLLRSGSPVNKEAFSNDRKNTAVYDASEVRNFSSTSSHLFWKQPPTSEVDLSFSHKKLSRDNLSSLPNTADSADIVDRLVWLAHPHLNSSSDSARIKDCLVSSNSKASINQKISLDADCEHNNMVGPPLSNIDSCRPSTVLNIHDDKTERNHADVNRYYCSRSRGRRRHSGQRLEKRHSRASSRSSSTSQSTGLKLSCTRSRSKSQLGGQKLADVKSRSKFRSHSMRRRASVSRSRSKSKSTKITLAYKSSRHQRRSVSGSSINRSHSQGKECSHGSLNRRTIPSLGSGRLGTRTPSPESSYNRHRSSRSQHWNSRINKNDLNSDNRASSTGSGKKKWLEKHLRGRSLTKDWNSSRDRDDSLSKQSNQESIESVCDVPHVSHFSSSESLKSDVTRSSNNSMCNGSDTDRSFTTKTQYKTKTCRDANALANHVNGYMPKKPSDYKLKICDSVMKDGENLLAELSEVSCNLIRTFCDVASNESAVPKLTSVLDTVELESTELSDICAVSESKLVCITSVEPSMPVCSDVDQMVGYGLVDEFRKQQMLTTHVDATEPMSEMTTTEPGINKVLSLVSGGRNECILTNIVNNMQEVTDIAGENAEITEAVGEMLTRTETVIENEEITEILEESQQRAETIDNEEITEDGRQSRERAEIVGDSSKFISSSPKNNNTSPKYDNTSPMYSVPWPEHQSMSCTQSPSALPMNHSSEESHEQESSTFSENTLISNLSDTATDIPQSQSNLIVTGLLQSYKEKLREDADVVKVTDFSPVLSAFSGIPSNCGSNKLFEDPFTNSNSPQCKEQSARLRPGNEEDSGSRPQNEEGSRPRLDNKKGTWSRTEYEQSSRSQREKNENESTTENEHDLGSRIEVNEKHAVSRIDTGLEPDSDEEDEHLHSDIVKQSAPAEGPDIVVDKDASIGEEVVQPGSGVGETVTPVLPMSEPISKDTKSSSFSESVSESNIEPDAAPVVSEEKRRRSYQKRKRSNDLTSDVGITAIATVTPAVGPVTRSRSTRIQMPKTDAKKGAVETKDKSRCETGEPNAKDSGQFNVGIEVSDVTALKSKCSRKTKKRDELAKVELRNQVISGDGLPKTKPAADTVQHTSHNPARGFKNATAITQLSNAVRPPEFRKPMSAVFNSFNGSNAGNANVGTNSARTACADPKLPSGSDGSLATITPIKMKSRWRRWSELESRTGGSENTSSVTTTAVFIPPDQVASAGAKELIELDCASNASPKKLLAELKDDDQLPYFEPIVENVFLSERFDIKRFCTTIFLKNKA